MFSNNSTLLRFIQQWKIGGRLYFLTGMMLLLLILVGIAGITSLFNTNSNLEEVYSESLIPTGELANLNDAMQSSIEQVHLATKHDPRLPESSYHSDHSIRKHTDLIRDKIVVMNDLWKNLKPLILKDSPEEAEDISVALEEFQKNGLLSALRNIEEGEFERVNIQVATTLPKLYGTAKGHVEDTLKIQLEHASRKHDQSQSEFELTLFEIGGAILLGLVMGSLLSFMIIRSITAPLHDMIDRVTDIAEGEGDLTRRLEIHTKDELKQLVEGINRFIIKIHEIVTLISTNSSELKSSSDNLNENTSSMTAGIEQMSQQSQLIASSVTEMNQTLESISSAVEEMSISITEVAKKSADAAASARVANQTVIDTDRLFTALSGSAREIGVVIESIGSIAGQTNLLALNAAIEAAGAGDAGRGFAVVASEVKELARQASDSSDNIKEKVTGIQKNTEKAVSAMNEISGTIQKVNEISGAIASAVEEQSITSREIANNVAQTTMASNDIAKNITGISEASRDGAHRAAENSRLAGNLKDLADNLNSIVRQFKI